MTDDGIEPDPSLEEDLEYYRQRTCREAESTRKGKLLSRPEAAGKLGVKPRRVRSWEDGARELTVPELIVMAQRYEDDPVEMFKRIAKPRK